MRGLVCLLLAVVLLSSGCKSKSSESKTSNVNDPSLKFDASAVVADETASVINQLPENYSFSEDE